MKHLLRKKLSVLQVIAFIIVPLIMGFITFKLVVSNKPNGWLAKHTKRHSRQRKNKVADTSALGVLMSYVDSINNAEQLFGGSWSFYLTDVKKGDAICKINIDQGLSPASVMKIVTTGTALSLLGPEFKFSTILQYDGKIDPATKVLNGNIYIKGGGDPSLGAEAFGNSVDGVIKDWAESIKKLGIDSVAGSVIADAQSFEANPVPQCWTWEDMQCDYGTGSCGLNMHENDYDVSVDVVKGGTKIGVNPTIPGLKLYNQVVYNPAVAKSYIYVVGAPYQYERTIMGEVAGEYKDRSPIPDPAMFCAQALKAELKQLGIAIKDSATTMRILHLHNIKTDAKEKRIEITTTLSPSLAELVYHTNQISQNFYAENILRAIAWKEEGFGSSSKAINIIYDYWKAHGVDLRGMCMVDGCGLARMNTITTHQLVEMLRTFAKDSSVFPTFYRSLPVAGESGTIRKLADGTEADGNLHAKSGTMARIKSYAGYVKTKSGEMLCFAMVGNNTLWSEEELKDKFAKLFVLMARLP